MPAGGLPDFAAESGPFFGPHQATLEPLLRGLNDPAGWPLSVL